MRRPATWRKAEEILRKKGIASASKKASRVAREGVVASYIHLQGKVGVLVEINCETDFVAKNEVFRDFVKDITLHIAASHPLYVAREQVPETLIQAEREIYAAQVAGKPAKIVERLSKEKSTNSSAQSACLSRLLSRTRT
jgi:Translation elongation factor Ts